MPITEKPDSWRFEIDTPELGNEDAVTTALWEQEVLSRPGLGSAPDSARAEILYDGLLFRFASPLKIEAEARWADDSLCVTIAVKAFFTTQCSRCLEPTDIEFWMISCIFILCGRRLPQTVTLRRKRMMSIK